MASLQYKERWHMVPLKFMLYKQDMFWMKHHISLSVLQEYQLKSQLYCTASPEITWPPTEELLLQALCSSCCNMKFSLPYLDNKEGRVCQVCCNSLLRGNQVTIFQGVQSVAQCVCF